MFYDKDEALQNFAVRSGLINGNLLFSETELKIIHSNLIKVTVNFDNELSSDSIKSVKVLVEKIEDAKPEFCDYEKSFDFSKEFDSTEDLEIGD